jgi:hypothetical protein
MHIAQRDSGESDVDHLSDLNFEFSNEDKLRILRSLQVQPNTVTGFSKEL